MPFFFKHDTMHHQVKKKDNSEIVNFYQNHWPNFNKTQHKAKFDERDFGAPKVPETSSLIAYLGMMASELYASLTPIRKFRDTLFIVPTHSHWWVQC